MRAGLFAIILLLLIPGARLFAALGNQHVIILSIDGLSPAALEKAQAPIIKKFRTMGAVAQNARAIFPVKTITNHASMVSGVGFARHQMLRNGDNGIRIWVPTIFDLAKQNGLRTAMVASKPKFDRLVQPENMDILQIIVNDAPTVAGFASGVISNLSPHVMLVHFRDVDIAGHAHAWESPEQIRAIEQADRGLGILLIAIDANKMMSGRTTIVLTADHGGHGKNHFMPRDTVIPWYAVGPGITPGSRVTRTIYSYDTAAFAAHAAGLTVPRAWRWQGQVPEIEK